MRGEITLEILRILADRDNLADRRNELMKHHSLLWRKSPSGAAADAARAP